LHDLFVPAVTAAGPGGVTAFRPSRTRNDSKATESLSCDINDFGHVPLLESPAWPCCSLACSHSSAILFEHLRKREPARHVNDFPIFSCRETDKGRYESSSPSKGRKKTSSCWRASSEPRPLALMSDRRSAAPLYAAQAAAHTSRTGAGLQRAAPARYSIHGRRHSGPPPHRGSPPRCGDCAG
jgi:hypothetical protein